MSVSFRIKTAQGQELSFASREMFVEFIRAGDLADTDLVYDAETKGWSPARTHPLVLEIQYEAEAEAEEATPAEAAGDAESAAPAEAETEDAPSEEVAAADESEPAEEPSADNNFGLDLAPAPPEPEEAEPAAVSDGGDQSFGLELAPETEGPTAEEQAEAFLAQMEAERAQEIEMDAPDPGMSGFTMETSGSLADMIAPEPVAPPTKPVEPEPEQKARVRFKPQKKSKTGRNVAIAVVVIALLGTGAFFARGFLPGASADAPADSVSDPGLTIPVEPPPQPEPQPEPTIASTDEAVQERAQERFLSATQALLRDLEPIAPEWLTGEYVSLPSEYEAIKETWESYRDTVQGIRGTDADRYLEAYELALDDAAVPDEERPDRIARAVTAFEENVTAADEHWARAIQLAVAAIQSHEALLDAEGLILYDASGTTGRGPGLAEGASGRDSDAQLLLDQVVDAMNTALDGDGAGPRSGENVREWIWGGFLDAVTR